jgi:hypothetical protein
MRWDMRSLLVMAVVLLLHCGSDDTTTSVPKDLAVTPIDCAHLVYCPCGDGTCQVRSGCSPSTCDDACSSHGGTIAGTCTPADGG